MAQSLRVIGEEQLPEETSPIEAEKVAETPKTLAFYAHADPVDLSEYSAEYSFPRFVRAVAERAGRGELDVDDARVVDAMPNTMDIDFGLLLAFPDETLMFVGSDPTAKDAIPWFAFTVGPMEPRPSPETCQEALDLLRPPEVRDLVHEEAWLPDRHGEWWLLPTNMMPVGSAIQPGVSSRPFGPSPLGNHVPREYGFTTGDDALVERFRRVCEDAPPSIQTPRAVVEWTQRQQRKDPVSEWAPSWADVQHCAGEVLVRGTIRHRDNDHFVEKLGDRWHRALTHDVEVYTGDAIATDIHLDYHGR